MPLRWHTFVLFLFFNDTATTEIYTLSLHDALPIWTWRFAAPPENVVILGTQELGIIVSKELRRRDDLNLNVVGFIQGDAAASAEQIAESPVLGNASALERIVREHSVSRIIVALEDRRGSLPVRELVKLRVEGVRVED